MRKKPLLITLGLLALTAVSAAAIAQVDGLDVQVVQKRAETASRDAAAFAAEVQRRAAAMRADAEQARDQGQANRARVKPGDIHVVRGAGGVDLDQLIADGGTLKYGATDPRPRLIAFASLSMPPDSLRRMIADVSAAGGVVVFQGFPNNSVKAFMAGLARAMDIKGLGQGVGIDPRLFRAFDVHAVPQYVVTSTDFQLCDGFACRTPTPPYDRLIGNVTTQHALELFKDGGGPGASVARVYLAQLRAKGRAE